MPLVFAGVCSHAPGITGRSERADPIQHGLARITQGRHTKFVWQPVEAGQVNNLRYFATADDAHTKLIHKIPHI